MSDIARKSQVQQDRQQEVYVGPRPFERSERGLFFGRDREISELLSLVISSRVVLCYAPSGAGKTSLINAGLEPQLEKEGFEVLPSIRVRGLIPKGIPQENISNIYLFNALLGLAGEVGEPDKLVNSSLAEFFSTRQHPTDNEGFPLPRILIFDQFEELLTSYPERWQERDGFFHQVHDALQADSLLRVLFIMREDFLARIEPFTRFLKPFQQARFRLNLLGPEGARAAVVGPLRGTDRRFKEGVVNALIEELLKVRVETTQGEAVEVVGEYVEPVQLQVVCRNLWTSLPSDVQEISHEHLKTYGDVDHALRDFYESCLAESRTSLGANELGMRQWFEHQLITPASTRGIVFRDTERTAELPNSIVDFLENRHLIRGEWRAGSRWYELTHDRFIEPIQRANEHWRAQRQSHRNRLVMMTVIPLLLAVIVFAGIFSVTNYSSQSMDASTAVAATVGVVEANAQATAQVQAEAAQVQVQVAQEDVALSKSRQLAAEALLTNDSELALLLAIKANQSSDTLESRKSLQKILSRQAVIDGNFLLDLNPEIVSPSLAKLLLVKLLEENNSYVQSLAFSPDGTRFISGSQNGTLILWDLASAKPVGNPLPAPSSSIMSVGFSPDGKYIAAGTTGEQILVWDAATGQPIGKPLTDHTGFVTSVAFSPDGKKLASGSNDKTVRIWDVSTWQSRELTQPADVWSVAWSPDGKILAVAGAGSNIRLLDAETFARIGLLQGDNGFVRTLAWSPDSRMLVSGSASREGEPTYGEVTFWDPATSKRIAQLQFNNKQPVRTVVFDPMGRIVAVGQDNGTITLMDANSKQPLGDPIQAHGHRVMSIAFSPDGRYMISGSIDTKIAIWDLIAPTRSIAVSPKGDLLASSQGTTISVWNLSSGETVPVSVLYGHTGDVLVLKFSPDGSILVSTGRDGTIRLWNASTGEPFANPFTGHDGDITTLDISPDSSVLASGGQDGKFIFWNIARQTLIASVEFDGAPVKVSFTEGGNSIELVTSLGELITLDSKTYTELKSELLAISQMGGQIENLALSPDGQKAGIYQAAGNVSLSNDERAHGITISLWDESFAPTVKPDDIDFIVVKASQGNFVDRNFEGYLQSIQQIPIRGAMHFFQADVPWQEQADFFLSTVNDEGFHFYVLDLEVKSEDGKTTFLADAEKWLKYVDDKVEQKVLLQTLGSYMTSFGTDGNWMKEWPLLIMQYPLEPDRNGSPVLPTGITDWKIWNYSDGRGMGAEYGVGGNDVYLEVFNGTPKEMWEWLIPTFSIYNRPSGPLTHPNQLLQVTELNNMVFSPDGSYLAAANNGMVYLFDPASGEEISTLYLGGRRILSLSFTLDSRLAIGTEDGTVLLWKLGLLNVDTNPEPYRASACLVVKRDFTDPEWQQFFGDTPKVATCPNLP